MEYVQAPGPHPGEQYMPSNGTEGELFIESWCGKCEHDKEMNGTCHSEGRDPVENDWCPILGASFRGEAVEWRELEDGTTKCVAFAPKGERIPAARCEHTKELPL